MTTKKVTQKDGLIVNTEIIPLIIQTATQYQCGVYLADDSGMRANAKSLLGIMSFIPQVRDSLEIIAEGAEDEAAAAEALCLLLCGQKV